MTVLFLFVALLLAPTLALATASLFALMSAAPRSAEASTGVARCAMPDGSSPLSAFGDVEGIG